jgi:1,4-dihydroxy-2-naphthoate octaprenyltransferase
MAAGTGLAEALANGAVRAAMVSSFGTYAVFVMLGYLKDVEADRATHYNTVAVRFGRRATVVASAAFATLGLAASVWLVQPRLTVSAGTALWSLGVVLLFGAHVLAWKSTTDHDAWPGIQASVHGFVALHLGEAAAIKPRWTLVAWILFGASIVAMFRRPVRRQV